MNERVASLFVKRETPVMEVLRIHAGATERNLPAGIALVVDGDGKLVGTITDGDVRRGLLRNATLELAAKDVMTPSPITFDDRLTFQQILERLPDELQKRNRHTTRFLGKIVLVDASNRPTRVLDYHQLWEQRVATHRHVVVLGLGYVGLTLGLGLANEGFRVTGVDVDENTVARLRRGDSHVHEIGLPELLRERLGKTFSVDSNLPDDGDVFVLAVGTPVERLAAGADPVPSLRHVEHAAAAVGDKLRSGALVILRSTVPVGTTRRVVIPILEQRSGLTAGTDFHVAFAPERTVEGKALQELRTLPQIVGGINDDSVEATVALFRELAPTIVRVESIEAAELVKLVNNGFRDLVFAFSNEVTKLASSFNLDGGEVIRAANRGYPRDPVPLPSPGVGGPCLTKDPWILATMGDATLSRFGRRVNESMHTFVVDAVLEQLARLGKDAKKSSVLVCGLAFKGQPETADLRNSTSMDIARLLKERVGAVFGHDPVADAREIEAAGIVPAALPDAFDGKDAVLFLNNHPSYTKVDAFRMTRALRGPAVIYDAWRLFAVDDVLTAAPSVYMGLGFHRSSVSS